MELIKRDNSIVIHMNWCDDILWSTVYEDDNISIYWESRFDVRIVDKALYHNSLIFKSYDLPDRGSIKYSNYIVYANTELEKSITRHLEKVMLLLL